MIQSLYVDNFRCLQNFELRLAGSPATLLLGQNGSGKSCIGKVLGLLREVSLGRNRVGELVTKADLPWGRLLGTMSFKIEVELASGRYYYELDLELPEHFHELRVAHERLLHDQREIYQRKLAEVRLGSSESGFRVDWHNVALPILMDRPRETALADFRHWLSGMLILAPNPSLISGDSQGETLHPDREMRLLGGWFTALMGQWPAAYSHVEKCLRTLLPSFSSIVNRSFGSDSRSLFLRFQDRSSQPWECRLQELSDGEKCFVIGALVLAANAEAGPLVCFWDEPDNFLVPSEVAHFVMDLRRSFQYRGQLVVVSHSPLAIKQFSEHNSYLLERPSHMSPSRIRLLQDLDSSQDLFTRLQTGDFNT